MDATYLRTRGPTWCGKILRLRHRLRRLVERIERRPCHCQLCIAITWIEK